MKKLLFLCLLLCAPLHAATYYVSKTANGAHASDSTNCSTVDGASTNKLTVVFGLGCLTAGDTLTIHTGTYAENLSGFTTGAIASGTSDAVRTTVQGAVGETVTITSMQIYSRSYITVKNITFNTGLQRIGRAAVTDAASIYVTFDSVTAINWAGVAGGGGAIMTGFRQEGVSSHITLLNCIVHNNGATNLDHGVYNSTRDTLIDGGSFYSNVGHGIHSYSGSNNSATNNLTVRFARVYSNGSFGIGLYSGTNQVVYNCLVYGNGTSTANTGGIRFWSGGKGALYNNSIYNHTNSGYGIYNDTAGNLFRNNIVESNTINIFSASGGTTPTYSNNLCSAAGTGCIAGITEIATVTFTSPSTADFTLKTGSQAINAGFSSAPVSTLVTTDFIGTSRPVATTWDIGAYEYATPASITITAPTGGVIWTIGDTKTITWNSVGTTGTIQIDLDNDGNGSYETAIDASDPDDGSYSWVVAGSAFASCKIRVKDTGAATFGVSPTVFEITAAPVIGTITLNTPVVGQVCPKGSDVIIDWDSTNVTGNVLIELSRNNGVTYSTIATVPYNSSNYVYTATTPSSSNCKIRVTSVNDGTVTATSAAFRLGGRKL